MSINTSSSCPWASSTSLIRGTWYLAWSATPPRWRSSWKKMSQASFNAVTVAGALGLLFLVDRRLTLLVAPACVVLVIVVNLFKRTIKRFTARIREAFAELTSQAFEVFSGIRIVKSFRLEDRKATEFRDRSLSMTKAKVRLARLSAIYGSSVDLLVLLATLAVIWFAAPAVVSNALKLGALVAFLGVMDKMFKPLVQLSKGNLKLQKALAAAD